MKGEGEKREEKRERREEREKERKRIGTGDDDIVDILILKIEHYHVWRTSSKEDLGASSGYAWASILERIQKVECMTLSAPPPLSLLFPLPLSFLSPPLPSLPS